MEMIYTMITGAAFIGLIALIFLIWSIRTGQFEDIEGPKYRIFHDEEDE